METRELTMAEECDPLRVATELGRLSEAVRGLRDDLLQADVRRDKLHSGLHEVAKLVQSTVPRIDSILESVAESRDALKVITPMVQDHERRITSVEIDIKDLKKTEKEFVKDKYVRAGVVGTVAAILSFFGLKILDLFKDSAG